ncbi:WGR domain-containing protein [Ensifer sp. MJa1]
MCLIRSWGRVGTLG